MRVAEGEAALLLAADGVTVLEAAGIEVKPLAWFHVYVVETEDLGLWIRRNDGAEMRVILLRWEYILAIDVALPRDVRRFGLK